MTWVHSELGLKYGKGKFRPLAKVGHNLVGVGFRAWTKRVAGGGEGGRERSMIDSKKTRGR